MSLQDRSFKLKKLNKIKLSETPSIPEIARNTIRQEAQSLNVLHNTIDEDFDRMVGMIFHCKGKVVVTGLGKSGLVGMKIAATLNSTGTPAAFLHAADATHGDLGMIQTQDVILIISKSGSSQEIINLVQILKNKGNRLIGMTANPESFLRKNTDYLLHTPMEKEACPYDLAPTTSTTLQMVMGDALAMSLMSLNGFKPKDFALLHPSGTLGKKLHLKVADLIMDQPMPSVSPETAFKEVIYEISDKRLGATIVEKNGKIQGLITDGDLRRAMEKTENFGHLTAGEIMSKNPVGVDQKMMAVEALNLMRNKKINHLIVLGNDVSYCGLVHILDFIKEGLN